MSYKAKPACPFCEIAEFYNGDRCELCGYSVEREQTGVVAEVADESNEPCVAELAACPVCGESDRFDGYFCQTCRVSFGRRSPFRRNESVSAKVTFIDALVLFFSIFAFALFVDWFQTGKSNTLLLLTIWLLWLAACIGASYVETSIARNWLYPAIGDIARRLEQTFGSLKQTTWPTLSRFGFLFLSMLPGAIAWQQNKLEKEKGKTIEHTKLEIQRIETHLQKKSERLAKKFASKSSNLDELLSLEKKRDFQIYKNALLEIERLVNRYQSTEPAERLVRFRCDKCEKKLKSHVKYTGQMVTCPQCRTDSKIPQPN